jgi:C-terminal processing protease CtpA/Prc
MIGTLKDVHSWFVDPSGAAKDTYQSPRFVNWNRSLWVEDVRRHQNFPQQTNWGYMMFGDIPYVYFGAWNRSQVKTADVDAVFERFRNAPAMVIDVRANGGGDESLAQEFAGRFYDQPHIYRYGANRNGPRHSDMETPHAVVLAPRGSWQFKRPVLVLAGRGSFSATEDFVCMMRVLPHVTIAGDTTGGGSGNPGFYDLGDGWKYTVPRSIGYTSAMQIVEWNGIAPAVVIPMSNADVDAGRDPVFEYAEKWAAMTSHAAGGGPAFTTPS